MSALLTLILWLVLVGVPSTSSFAISIVSWAQSTVVSRGIVYEMLDSSLTVRLRLLLWSLGFNILFDTLPLRLLFVKCVRMASKCSDRILHMAAECSLGKPDNIFMSFVCILIFKRKFSCTLHLPSCCNSASKVASSALWQVAFTIKNLMHANADLIGFKSDLLAAKVSFSLSSWKPQVYRKIVKMKNNTKWMWFKFRQIVYRGVNRFNLPEFHRQECSVPLVALIYVASRTLASKAWNVFRPAPTPGNLHRRKIEISV